MTIEWQPEWNALITKYFGKYATGDWDGLHNETIKQILENEIKLEKITKFAMNLVYANPHISWQLKQLLHNAPPKTVT